jgi:hypothetical protein
MVFEILVNRLEKSKIKKMNKILFAGMVFLACSCQFVDQKLEEKQQLLDREVKRLDSIVNKEMEMIHNLDSLVHKEKSIIDSILKK